MALILANRRDCAEPGAEEGSTVVAPDLKTLNVIYFALLLGSAATACAYAWRQGGRAERIAVVFYGSSWIGSTACTVAWLTLWGTAREPLAVGLIWDLYPAAVFLVLAVRDDNLWLGAAAAAQGLQMALRAVSLVLWAPSGSPGRIAMSLVIALMSYVMMGALVGSAMTRRLARSPVQAA